jgi:hypothetical protein
MMTVQEFNTELENGAYAWPGGYPKYFRLCDGESLSFEAAQEMAQEIREALTERNKWDQWAVAAVDINWEDSCLFCIHTGERIESAYTEEDE